jgi:endonuclease/exonuclease/phosphatase family metal-dependent hydrolase
VARVCQLFPGRVVVRRGDCDLEALSRCVDIARIIRPLPAQKKDLGASAGFADTGFANAEFRAALLEPAWRAVLLAGASVLGRRARAAYAKTEIIDECLQGVFGLAYGNEQQQRCYTCFATQLPQETFGRIRETCPTVVNHLYSYRGQNDLMIVSRYPLKNEQIWLVPGGWGNRGILSATAELPNGSELDLFCNHLTNIPRSLAWPYTGQYGNGETGQEAWEEEQFLQTQKLIAFVENVSADRPAIILGDMNSGYPYPPDPSFEETVRAINLLESSFTPAYTDDYVPVCTYCDTNPLNDIEPDRSRWIDHILLQNIPVEAVKATHVRRR